MEYKNVTIAPSSARRVPKSAVSAKKSEPEKNHTVYLKREEISPAQEMPEVMRPREGGKYRYIKTIGRGGMKVVLEVHDNDTMRNVAMALLPDISTRSKLEQGQFLREARITASLEHPNIVPVHDIGMDSSGSPYFTMKLLRGRTLAFVLKKLEENDPEYLKQYSFYRLMRIYNRICNAVAFAHSQGVLHLDLKPENVQIGDYGEVLVLDWGLARKIVPVQNVGHKISSKTRKIRRSDAAPAENQVNGTPGYMAPEQISGGRHSCSPQTDIYSLGAILYAMITYKNPLNPGNIEQMLRDTLSGNILRPSLRAGGREIPYGIEAVVLKSMSLNPEDRYASVKDLRDEVVNFIGGYATSAENAGLMKKTMLFMRRHARSLISGTVILLLSLLLGFFSWREAHRIISLWVPVLSMNFQKSDSSVDACSFRCLNLKESGRSWRLDPARGLCPEKDQWLVFRESFPDNIRITLDLSSLPEKMNMLEIAVFPASFNSEISLNSSMVSCRLFRRNSRSYTAEILESRNFFAPRILASVALPNFRNHELNVVMEHENGTISFRVNRKEVLKVPSSRLFGNGSVSVAIRTDMPEARIRDLEICRLAPPENATDLLAGDTLLEERLYEQAVRRYLAVDDNRPGSKLAEKALLKAYLAAFRLEPAGLRREFILDIKKRLAAKYPDFNLSQFLIADACTAWKDRDYTLAVMLMNKAFEADPDTQIVAYIMELPHKTLPDEIQMMLMKLIRRTRGITSLDLSDYGLTSLRGIAGMHLASLNCSGNRLTSLHELAGMPLKSLDCSRNRISSVECLRSMPLRYLDCSNNRIRDFSPLEKLSLRRFDLTGNPVPGSRKPAIH